MSFPFFTNPPLFTVKGTAKQILEHDRARIRQILQRVSNGPKRSNPCHAQSRARQSVSPASPVQSTFGEGVSVPITNAVFAYTVSVRIGDSPIKRRLLIDTGSANTWVGAGDTLYRPTSTGRCTGNTMNVKYGSGSFSGYELIDQICIGNKLVIKNQSIGVAGRDIKSRICLNGLDGILGLGPVALSKGTISNTDILPTIMDNLVKQGVICEPYFGISLAPTMSVDALEGQMTFGKVDPTKNASQVTYVPITSNKLASSYWGIDQTIRYGEDTQLLHMSPGLVDTGTALLYLVSDAFKRYQMAVGAVLDPATGLFTVTQEQYENMKSMFINIGSATLELIPNAQILPRLLNPTFGGERGKIYLSISDLRSDDPNISFINGLAFLQRYYSAYDATNAQVGFAPTCFTKAETN